MNDIARALIYVAEENNPDLVVDIYRNVVAARNVSCVDITAQRHAEVVTGIADEATTYGVGKQRRAVVTAALSALCPAL